MKKRIIALVVLMAMVISMTSQLVSADEATTYEVGYAKVDINPIIDGELLEIPLAGGARTRTRLSQSIADDDGDGVVDANEGIFATCIAITDQAGKTVLLISCDIANAYTPFVEPVRQQILAQYAEQYGLEADRILINASHTHSGPMLVAGWEKDETFGEAYTKYQELLISRLVQVAGDALADRAPATMSKGSQDASDYAQSAGYGERAYNTVRHYVVTMAWVGDESQTYTYVCGDNFNDFREVGEYATIDEKTYRVTNVEPVTQADDTMQVVKFAFEGGKDPIALVNWRAHGTLAKGDGASANYLRVSGDYVNVLRNTLAESNYRTAFFQGAAGNINPASQLSAGSWVTDVSEDTRYVTYGEALAEVALECLKNNMQPINQDGGEIRSVQKNHEAARQSVTAFQYLAAFLYKAEDSEAGENGINGNRVYENLYYYEDANGVPQIYTSGNEEGTLIVTDENVEQKAAEDETTYTKVAAEDAVVVASIFHANALVDGYRANGQPGMVLELNAVTIGDEFSLVTSAGEPFDYYNNANSQNKWNDVGADFVLGYTNIGGGYLASQETFSFNAGLSDMAAGSYETMCNNIGVGTGEAVVDQLDVMLDFLQEEDFVTTDNGECVHCGEPVEWTDLATVGELSVSNVLRGGHYYLSGNTTLRDIDAMEGAKICLNTNGYTLTVAKGFAITSGTTLSVMGGGAVAGEEASGSGGVFNVKLGGTLNLYDATLEYTGEAGGAGNIVAATGKNGRTIEHGGILDVAGTFNMYGGLVKGTNVYGSGGAMRITATGVANIFGGEIRDMNVNQPWNAGSRGEDCIRNSGKIVLSGDAQIDEIYIYKPDTDAKLCFAGEYTGTFALRYTDGINYINEGTIGTYDDANISRANITVNNGSDYVLQLTDGNVVINTPTVFEAVDKESGATKYADVYADLGALTEDSFVVLRKDTTADITVTESVYWDLNGKTVTGAVTVSDGKTLQVIDRTTADYDATGGYGKIKVVANGTGKVVGATADNGDIYIPVPEADDYTSYHAADLDIDAMGLKAEKQGLYFAHTFKGDAVLKAAIDYYGVALSLEDNVTQEAMQAAASKLSQNVQKNDSLVFTSFAGNTFGSQTATSTLVSGIMKTANGVLTNQRNADMKIYGAAYVKLTNSDTYIIGEVKNRSLREQIEGVDEFLWDSMNQGQKNEILKAYETKAYNQVMSEWNIPNIQDPEKEQAAEEQEIIRILGVGNSHTVDATRMLHAVFVAEGYDPEKVMIGNMYKSGCTVEEHVNYNRNSTRAYIYYHTNEEGAWEETASATLKTGLEAEVWDYVVLHEMNVSVIHKKTYMNTNLQTHINNVKASTIGTPKILWNLSWANPVDRELLESKVDQSWIDCYEDYSDLNYTTMFTQMVSKTQQYVVGNKSINKNLSGVAPTGTAICYAKNELGLTDADLYRDYTHMSEFGRLLSAYVWYATITGQQQITEVKVNEIPAALLLNSSNGPMEVTEEMKNIIIESVNYALSNKFEVTPEK